MIKRRRFNSRDVRTKFEGYAYQFLAFIERFLRNDFNTRGNAKRRQGCITLSIRIDESVQITIEQKSLDAQNTPKDTDRTTRKGANERMGESARKWARLSVISNFIEFNAPVKRRSVKDRFNQLPRHWNDRD
jgi:hypothetical protein